jgi:hypothetical protein
MIGTNAHRLARKIIIGRFLRDSHPHQRRYRGFQAFLQKIFFDLEYKHGVLFKDKFNQINQI